MIADVVEPIGRRAGAWVGMLSAPARIGSGDPIGKPRHRFRDVVDIREIPLHVAVVEHLDRLAGQDRPREQEHRHVRPAPWAVHGEEANPGSGQAEQVAVGVRHQLVRFLGGGVEADRMIDVLVHRERHTGHRAVHRAR